jgi:hypothetical protein
MSGASTTGGAKVRAGTNTAVSLVGAAVILVAVNYLSMRHYVRADWTSSGIYTLSDKSLKMLSALDEDVEIHVLWSQADERFLDVRELLDRYAAASPRLSLEIVDPDLDQERMQLLIGRYGAKMRDMGGGMMAIEASVIVVSGDNVKFVSSADFEDLSDGMYGPEGGHEEEVSGYKAEQAISSAILTVTAENQAEICFTQGHGEWVFEGYGGRGLGAIREGLKQDGYQVEAITTTGASRVKPGCELVVVAGPDKAFMEEEATILEKYVERGGRLLMMLDPIIEGVELSPTGLEQLTARFGIKLSRDVILETDPRRLVGPSPFTFMASEFTSHDSVKQLSIPESAGAGDLSAYPVVFSTSRSLVLREGAETVADVLARTSPISWGEVDVAALSAGEAAPTKDQYDTAGPAALAVAASLPTKREGEEPGRVVVVGDSDFLAEELLVNASLSNRDFWSGLVGWLTSRADLISIAPKNPEHVRLNLTAEDVGTVWQIVVGEVLFFVVLGVVVWLRRRS